MYRTLELQNLELCHQRFDRVPDHPSQKQTDENTKITDSLFTFDGKKWQVESSSYTKLRLRKQRVEAVVKQSAFDQVKLSNRGGLEYLIAIKE